MAPVTFPTGTGGHIQSMSVRVPMSFVIGIGQHFLEVLPCVILTRKWGEAVR